MKKELEQRTPVQNRALHVYFRLLADALNDAGFEIAKVIKVDTPWNERLVKELLWKSVQDTYLNKKSTVELNKGDIDKVYEILNRAIGEKTGVFVPFPSNNNENTE